MIYCLYRISDNGYVKPKLPHATKEHCLSNFMSVFGHEPHKTIVFADRVVPEKYEWLKNYVDSFDPNIITLQDIPKERGGSSAQSFRYAFEYAIENLKDDDIVYLVEDDYLHLPFSDRAIEEGLQRADYVTLYDHIDKYVPASKGGNPFIDESGSDETRVILTPTTHWRMTNSTTCTFAAKVKTLKQDLAIWKQHCFADDKQTHPHDFPCFIHLRNIDRTLISPIPGLSTHVEPMHLTPRINWELV